MTRNKEEDHGQDGEDTKYKELPKKLQRADVRPPPDDRRLKHNQRQLQHLPASGRPDPTRSTGNINGSPRTPNVRCLFTERLQRTSGD